MRVYVHVRERVYMCMSLDEPSCVHEWIFSLSLPHCLSFIMSSSFQIFCVRNKVNMRNFTGGRGKNTLDYMVWKYECVVYMRGRKHPKFQTAHYPCITTHYQKYIFKCRRLTLTLGNNVSPGNNYRLLMDCDMPAVLLRLSCRKVTKCMYTTAHSVTGPTTCCNEFEALVNTEVAAILVHFMMKFTSWQKVIKHAGSFTQSSQNCSCLFLMCEA